MLLYNFLLGTIRTHNYLSLSSVKLHVFTDRVLEGLVERAVQRGDARGLAEAGALRAQQQRAREQRQLLLRQRRRRHIARVAQCARRERCLHNRVFTVPFSWPWARALTVK